MGVQRAEENGGVFEKDALGAVAVVIVDIQHGHTGPQPARGDGAVVEITKAAVQVRGGVVAGRAAQGVGRGLAPAHRCRRRQGALRAPVGRRPGAFEQRAADAKGVVASLAKEGAGTPHPAPDAKRRRKNGRGPLEVGGAVGVGGLQEVDEAGVVHGQNRIQAKVCPRGHRPEIRRAHRRQQQLGPRRHLVGHKGLAINDQAGGVVEGVVWGEEGVQGKVVSGGLFVVSRDWRLFQETARLRLVGARIIGEIPRGACVEAQRPLLLDRPPPQTVRLFHIVKHRSKNQLIRRTTGVEDNLQSPISNLQSPITNYHLPITFPLHAPPHRLPQPHRAFVPEF
jgi:hypothetical protein